MSVGDIVGLESAIYSYRPAAGKGTLSMEVIQRMGATRKDTVDSMQWVMRGPTYWIDVEGLPNQDQLIFRIALSNPPDAIGFLKTVLEALIQSCGGAFMDLQYEYSDIPSPQWKGHIDYGGWQTVTAAYERKKLQAYKPFFGDFIAAISADELDKLAERDPKRRRA